MTTNSRKGDRHPCSEHHGLSNRKENCQCQQRDSIRESRKCYSRSTRYDPRRRMRISQEPRLRDRGTQWLFLIGMKALNRQPTSRINPLWLAWGSAKIEACFRILPVLDQWANQSQYSGAQVIRCFFFFLLSRTTSDEIDGSDDIRSLLLDYHMICQGRIMRLVSARLLVRTDVRSTSSINPWRPWPWHAAYCHLRSRAYEVTGEAPVSDKYVWRKATTTSSAGHDRDHVLTLRSVLRSIYELCTEVEVVTSNVDNIVDE
jgi:hypothetical protein